MISLTLITIISSLRVRFSGALDRCVGASLGARRVSLDARLAARCHSRHSAPAHSRRSGHSPAPLPRPLRVVRLYGAWPPQAGPLTALPA